MTGIDVSRPPDARDGEWSELVQCLDDSAVSRGGLVAVVGEVGIGKTRLTRDLGDHARSGAMNGWPERLELEWEQPFARVFLQRLAGSSTLVRYDMRGLGLSGRDNADVDLSRSRPARTLGSGSTMMWGTRSLAEASS